MCINFCIDVPYVPSDYRPIVLGSESVGRQVSLRCPLISNPPPASCNWSKYDNNNTRQEVVPGNYVGFGQSTHCFIDFLPLKEMHSGLYECTAENEIGTATYTFPERFNIESECNK